VTGRIRTIAVTLAGVLAGSLLTLAVQSRGAQVSRSSGTHRASSRPPATFLAWVPNGLPDGFGFHAAGLEGVVGETTVAEDNVWLRRSWSSYGAVVDAPRAPLAIPIDAMGVDPTTFARFLPPEDRSIADDLALGEGVLGATSAKLRGLGPGATLEFAGGVRVRIAAVLPDQVVGASELMVSRQTGAAIGIHKDRFLLLQVSPGSGSSPGALTKKLRALLPTTLGIDRRVQVRAPGDTPYLRAGDAVMPPVLLKSLFGEFAARPAPGNPGYLQIQPSWERTNLVTEPVPLLGPVTCNRAIIPQLRGAMAELRRRGIGSLVRTYDGCFAPRFINRDPSAMISHHAWGVAIDLNAGTNVYGSPPHQDPRLVRVMQRWGFTWGGNFIVPDGNHFEYRRSPLGGRS
jgi:D-alanyl-D-alanine carboxypeptidase-like protein